MIDRRHPAFRPLISLGVLVALLVTVLVMYAGYRSAKTGSPAEGKKGSGTAESTATASPDAETEQPDAEPETLAVSYVVVQIDGLNFRREPSQDALTFGGLKKGQRLVLITTAKDWYQVKDDKGRIGWVSSKPGYVEIEQ